MGTALKGRERRLDVRAGRGGRGSSRWRKKRLRERERERGGGGGCWVGRWTLSPRYVMVTYLSVPMGTALEGGESGELEEWKIRKFLHSRVGS